MKIRAALWQSSSSATLLPHRLAQWLRIAHRVAVVLLAWLAMAPAAHAGARLALVIGNATYADGPLANPANDARAMAEALRKLGFEIHGGKAQVDLGRAAMLQALRDFQKAAAGSEAALFYFAGHGVQVDGRNFLLPVGDRFSSEDDVKDSAVDVESVLGRLDASGTQVKLVILDACRDDPLPRSSRSATRGLARMDAPSGALIAFAAKAGDVAQDGGGRNGLYTKHLLAHIATPGISINEMFHRVRDAVEKESLAAGHLQSPREEDSLKSTFYFAPALSVPAPVPAPATPRPGVANSGPANLPGQQPPAQAVPAQKMPAVQIAEPPPAEYFVMPALGPQPGTSLRLAVLSEKPNGITDDDDWWVANRLSPLTYRVPNAFMNEVGDLPSFVPREFEGMRVVKVQRSNPVMAIYGKNFSEGRYLLGIDPASGQVLFAFDFSLYEWPKSFDRKEMNYVRMATQWAQVENNILYVSHFHRTYAKSSNGYNGYITAIDVQTNPILCRPQPLACNASNFVVKGDAIIAGYGFTAEKRFMYVLNKSDGRIAQQLPVKNYPEHLVESGGRLYVRTYNFDYVLGYK